MNYQNIHRLTNEEHGTINAALTSYADDTGDASEAETVRSLAAMIISGEVLIRPRSVESSSMRPSPDQLYTYQVHWFLDTCEHVATVVEFPSLSWLDADPRVALNGIRTLVAEVLEDIALTGEEPPAPGVR
jgi:hypothetical protein